MGFIIIRNGKPYKLRIGESAEIWEKSKKTTVRTAEVKSVTPFRNENDERSGFYVGTDEATYMVTCRHPLVIRVSPMKKGYSTSPGENLKVFGCDGVWYFGGLIVSSDVVDDGIISVTTAEGLEYWLIY